MVNVHGLILNIFLFAYRSEHGRIDGSFRPDSIQRFPGPLPINTEEWQTAPSIPLRTAAQKQSTSTKEASMCKCKMGCKTKTCICRKRGLKCTSACHAGRKCSNK